MDNEESCAQSKPVLVAEFTLLCIVIPGVIIVNKWAANMFLFLWSAALYSYILIRLLQKAKLQELWNWQAVTWGNLKSLLLRWVIACFGMTLFLYLYAPERIFALFYYRPAIIPFLLVLYPLLSALPQELVFCTFFFGRYKMLFGSGRRMVIASAVMFAYAHCLYINPVAPTLSFLGGLIFASTYQKTRSLAMVTIEHSLYGNFLFLIGLGFYFYGGAVR